MSFVRLPFPALIVLVGPSGAGKSVWAATHFRPDQIVATDGLRSLVGEGEHDQRAGKDAFDVLDLVLERRLKRKLFTIIDSLALDRARRLRYVELAARHGLPCIAIGFDTDAATCRARNKTRDRPVPAKVLSDQLATWTRVRDDELAADGFGAVHSPDETVRLVPPDLLAAAPAAARQKEAPMTLRFGLQIPSFTWPGGPPELARRLGDIATTAEQAGFTSLWVMDHFLQIPQVGREWQDMAESYTTLSWLAARTERVTLGTLVSGVTYRNPAHLAKIIATLDVLSGGRAVCGIGAGWFEREHKAYGWRFPPVAERFVMLEEALQVLRLMWGKGSPSFSGQTIEIAEAICYPRPLQEKVPILIGGGGEKKTLRLVAEYADACNLFGDAATVRHKLDVLHRHCAAVGRDPTEIEVTQLSTALAGRDEADLDGILERLRESAPGSPPVEALAAGLNAGTIDDHVGRFRELAEVGVQTAIVNLPDLGGPEPIERFAEIIAAFAV